MAVERIRANCGDVRVCGTDRVSNAAASRVIDKRETALFRRIGPSGLCARNDPRTVVADPHARYFGAELSERTLVPGSDARLGEIRFEDWLGQPALRDNGR